VFGNESSGADLPDQAQPQKRRRGRPRKVPVTMTRLSGKPAARRGAPRRTADGAPDTMIDVEFDDLLYGVEVLLRCANQL
jgi:hypothetical protein